MAPLAFNKRAAYDYDILEKFEGGLALTGPEVKSAKAGHVQFKGSFLNIRNGELWIKNLHVSRYAPAGEQLTYDPIRDRRVLVHKRELNRLIGKTQTEGLTLVPISVYTRGRLLKLEFALARGKRQFEKRAVIRKREVDREMRERMKE